MVRVLFRRPLPERYGRLSTHTALQWSFPGGGCGPSGVDVLVACFADHEGLAFAHRHQMHPRWPFWPTWLVEIGEFADVVDLQPCPSLAQFTPSGEEPMDQLVASDGGHDRFQIGYDGGALAGEWYPTEAGDQRFLPLLAVHGDLETGPGSVGGIDARLVLGGSGSRCRKINGCGLLFLVVSVGLGCWGADAGVLEGGAGAVAWFPGDHS